MTLGERLGPCGEGGERDVDAAVFVAAGVEAACFLEGDGFAGEGEG